VILGFLCAVLAILFMLAGFSGDWTSRVSDSGRQLISERAVKLSR
jgi:hypothetical protein